MHVALQFTLGLRPGINKVKEEIKNYIKLGTGSMSYISDILSSYQRTCSQWHQGGKDPSDKHAFYLGYMFWPFFVCRFPVRACEMQKNPWRVLHLVKGRKKPLSEP